MSGVIELIFDLFAESLFTTPDLKVIFTYFKLRSVRTLPTVLLRLRVDE